MGLRAQITCKSTFSNLPRKSATREARVAVAFPTLPRLILTGLFAIQPHSPTAYSKQFVPEPQALSPVLLAEATKALDVPVTLVRIEHGAKCS